MPEKRTIARAHKDARQGKSPSTQAGEFVREEIEHIRQGKHGARSAKQAIAIGLSKARRAGVRLAAPKKGKSSPRVRRQAKRELAQARHHGAGKTSRKRSRATLNALKREGSHSASHKALSRQARRSARKRGSVARHRAAMKAARTKSKV